MTISTITPLPTAPSRDDAPATFISRANAFLAALVTMGTELNTSIGEMNTDIAGVNADAAAAATSASEAAASATAAGNAAGASMWVSGQAYAEGDAAISGIDYQTYRAETATSGTTDPSADANWTKISGVLPSETGNAGKFLTTDGSTASWAAVSAGKVSRTATGAITAGDTVAINSDGTVSSVTGLEQAESVGTVAYFETSNLASSWWSAAYDTTADKGIINFTYNSDGYLRSRVVTNTGGTLTFGTLSVTANVAQTGTQCVYNADQDVFVITYHDTSAGVIKAVAAEIIGTVLNYGTPVTIGAGTFRNNAIQTTDSAEVLVVYRAGSNLAANTITCSGTTLTVNAQVTLSSVTIDTNQIGLAKNTSDGSFAAAFKDTSTSDPAVVKITVSGTTPTFGTSQKIASATMDAVNIIYNSYADRYIYVYYDQSASPYPPVYKSLSESGGTFTVESTASPTYTTAQNGVKNELSYDPTNNVVMASQANSDGTDMIAYSIVLNDENFTFGASTDFAAASATNGRFVQYYDPDEQDFVVFYRSDTSSNYSAANAFDPAVSYSTRDRYLGIADTNIADAASGDITIVSGLNANVTGLTAGDFYYLSETGALTATSNGYPVGHALSATSILLDNVGVNAIPEQSGNSGKFLTTDGSNSSWGSIERLGATAKWSWIQTSFHDGGLTMAIPQSGMLTGDWLRSTYGGVGVTDYIVYPIYSISYSEYHGAWFGIANREGQGTSSNWDIVRSYDGINWLTYFKGVHNKINGGTFQPYSDTVIDSVLAIDDQTGWLWIINGDNSSPYDAYAHYWRPGVDNGTTTWSRVTINTSGNTQYKSSFIKYINHPTNPGLVCGFMNRNNTFTMMRKSAGTSTSWSNLFSTGGFDGSDSNVCHFMWNPDDGVAFVSGFKNRQNGFRSTNPLSSFSATGSINTSANDKSNVCVGNGFLIVTFNSSAIRYSTDNGVSFQQQSGFNTTIRRVYFDGTNFLYVGDSESYTNTDPSKALTQVPIVYDNRDFGKPQFRGV